MTPNFVNGPFVAQKIMEIKGAHNLCTAWSSTGEDILLSFKDLSDILGRLRLLGMPGVKFI